MSVYQKEYTDLDRALNEVRSIAEEWSPAQQGAGPDDETVRCTSLVLHEWIANLHQYADFQDRSPFVEIRLSCEDRQVVCSVKDNSEGFDLETNLPSKDDAPDPLPERGMGLRIISTCTESVSYTPTNDGLQCFEFFISFDHDPWLNTLF